MHTIIIAALIGATIATPTSPTGAPYTTTPGYDRPMPTNGHEHVVYWASVFDEMDFDVQAAADARSVDDLHTKAKPKKPSK